MIRTLKTAFGLGLLAALSMAAMSVVGASAKESGHFFTDAPSGAAILDIKESTNEPAGGHEVKLEGWGATVQCHTVKYTRATPSNGETPTIEETSTAINVTPDYSACTRDDGSAVTVKHNECHFVFTPNNVATHATAHLKCPVGKTIEVETNRGTMRFPEQTRSGITYTTATNGGKHTITADITVTNGTGTCHGLCQILGTHRNDVKMTGSVTIEGTDKVSLEPVNITHT